LEKPIKKTKTIKINSAREGYRLIMPVKVRIVSARKQKVPVKIAKAKWREYLNY
jgi:hypothetical protein